MLKILAFLSKRQNLETKALLEHYETKHSPLIRSLTPMPFVYKRSYLVRGELLNLDDGSIDFDVVRDERGRRRPSDDARQRFERLRTNAEALSLPPLARPCSTITDGLFARLSHFLRDPTWEPTSNGAERAGCVFRHLGATRFRLRIAPSIGAHLAVHAQGRRHHVEGLVERPRARSRRGRLPARPDPRATIIASAV